MNQLNGLWPLPKENYSSVTLEMPFSFSPVIFFCLPPLPAFMGVAQRSKVMASSGRGETKGTVSSHHQSILVNSEIPSLFGLFRAFPMLFLCHFGGTGIFGKAGRCCLRSNIPKTFTLGPPWGPAIWLTVAKLIHSWTEENGWKLLLTIQLYILFEFLA